MITDDTILGKLRWQQFGDKFKSHSVAKQKYDEIIAYVFPDLDTTNFRVEKDGIEIKAWRKDECFKGINLNFYDTIQRKTCFRCIEFKGTALDFKAKVWQKFEVLKALKQESDAKGVTRENELTARTNEIDELTKIVKQKFNRYAVTITRWGEGYRLQLETNFDNKSDLLDFCIPGE